MRLSLSICLLLLAGVLFSQGQFSSSSDFREIDYKTRFIDENDPAVLAAKLTAFCHTDKEKVRVIFRWITENISYYRATSKKGKTKNIYEETEDNGDDTSALKSVTERIALKVLKDRRTYCEGYARLFKSLCDHTGIQAAIVTGYARTDIYRMESTFRTNHSWNAVYFDSAWHLLDATWAAGYTASFSGDFVKQYNEYYFLTDPEEFAQHHFPDDLRWTLLTDPPILPEFRRTPFRQRSFIKYGITDFSPSKGIINAYVGDTISIELETIAGLYRPIAPDSIWDSINILTTPVTAYVQPVSSLTDKKVYYKFPVNSDKAEWLYIMYNDDAVLRYRLNIKEKNLAKK